MRTGPVSVRTSALVSVAALLVLGALAGTATAQSLGGSVSDPATGEKYHIEAAAGFWFPTAEMSISSQQFGIQGSTIDFKKDLGLTDQRMPEIRLEARGNRSKFRFQYIPIRYEQTGALPRDIVFNGQRYRVGLPVNSTLDWAAYRFGYEYDFIRRDRGFAGVVFELKYTDVKASLLTAGPLISESIEARAPIPGLGLNVRGYVVPNISITGEVTAFKLPEHVIKDTLGHYIEVDVYGTVNFTNYVGVQAGFRSLDVNYQVNTDTGSFLLKGLYFRLVARY